MASQRCLAAARSLSPAFLGTVRVGRCAPVALAQAAAPSQRGVATEHASMGPPAFQHLELSTPSPNVTRVALNRPDRSNALSMALWREIHQCFEYLGADPDCRAVILTGNGKNFCSGIDLADFAGIMGGGPDVSRNALKLHRSIRELQAGFTAIEQCPKPVIAAVHGACIGGAVDMISACDIRHCHEDTTFQIKEVDLGLAADVGTLQRLPKIIGNDSLTRELCFTARPFTAAQALEYGLVSAVGLDRVEVLAAEIAAKSPIAVAGTKVNLNYSRDHSVQESLEYMACWNMAMLQTADIPAAMRALAEEQTATFSKL